MYNDPSPQSSTQWYESPALSDGSHTVSISRIAGTSVDYMVVTAGLTTPLSGQTLIVDDSDSSIAYSGSWSTPTGPFTINGDSSVDFYAHRKTLHRMSTVGSSLSLQFTGTSVSVYSVFDYSSVGHMVVVYSVDSESHTQPYTVSSSSPGYRPNILLFSKDGLEARTHTLKIQMTSNNGMALAIDYILYQPSFKSLAEKLGINTATIASPTSPSSPTTTAAAATDTILGTDTNLGTDTIRGTDTHSSTTSPSATQSSLVNSASVSGSILSHEASSTAGVVPSGIDGSSKSNPDSESSTSNPSSSPPIDIMAVRPFFDTTSDASYHQDTKTPITTASISHLYGSTAGPSTNGSDAGVTSLSPTPVHNKKTSTSNFSTSNPDASSQRQFRSRMQRIQDLVQELNEALTVGHSDAAHIAELRGRIKELTRESGVEPEVGFDWRRATPSGVPPPYER
ncbi:hypothetical protein H0H87_005824 [Tephrocybe sp. NHM501043]|nr:hypothetical protein H0H87_005824 [Tephrocybe sp. NHM501043]